METYERKNTRTHLTLLANITFYNNPNRLFLVENISISGMFVASHLNIVTGIDCLLELNSKSPNVLLFNQKISGRVMRRSKDGFGIQFTRMNFETYLMLRQNLLYSCRNSLALGEEFIDNCLFP